MKKMGDLGQILKNSQTDWAIGACQQGDLQAFRALKRLGLDRLNKDQRSRATRAFYAGAKESLAQGCFDLAVRSMNAASELAPQNSLVVKRLELLKEAAARREDVRRRMSIHEMQRQLQSICLRNPCVCKSHYQVAACRGIVEEGFPKMTMLDGVCVHTMGPYRAYTRLGKWTWLLAAIKHGNESRWLEVIADIVADYIVDETELLKSVDVLVPIPPDPTKFVRRGFAPNEILAQHLSKRVGVIPYPALVRELGPPTREASDEELAAEFRIEEQGISLESLSVLLVEDIWTWGRTIPVCAEKLRGHRVLSVTAIALGKSER